MTQPTPLDATASAALDALVSRLQAQLPAIDPAAPLPVAADATAADAVIGSTSAEVIGEDGTRYIVTIIAHPPAPPTA